MKRVFLFLTIFMMVFCAHAQYGQTYTQYFDSVFINIDKSDALTGILYERVVPFAHLNDFNSAHNPDVDTINASIFKQAYSELYNAAFNPATRLPYNLDSIKKMQMSDTGFVGIGVVPRLGSLFTVHRSLITALSAIPRGSGRCRRSRCGWTPPRFAVPCAKSR